MEHKIKNKIRDSHKVEETKKRIKDAFFELYEIKKIERISIKEITEKAMLNRGTFYVYYQDIYDLLEKAEDELVEMLVEKIKGVATMILRDEDIYSFLPPLEFYETYGAYLRVLLGNNGDPHFIYKIKSIVKETILGIFQQERIPALPRMDYVLEYMASAQVGLISYWIQNDMKIPIHEMGDLIKALMLNGPVGYVKSFQQS